MTKTDLSQLSTNHVLSLSIISQLSVPKISPLKHVTSFTPSWDTSCSQKAAI